METNSKELEEYLKQSLSAIKKGVENGGDFYISEPIEFDLAVINIQEGGGGFKIYVANAEGKLKSEKISHIKIKVRPDRNKETKILTPKQRRKDTYI